MSEKETKTTKKRATKEPKKELNEFEKFFDTPDDTSKYDKKDIESGKLMAVLSYIIPFVPYFFEKKNKYVKYHATQGMNLMIFGLAYGLLHRILSYFYNLIICGGGLSGEFCISLRGWTLPWFLSIPMALIGFALSALTILGIVYVCNNQAKELPLLNKFKVIK